MFPLFKNDHKPSVRLTNFQKESIALLLKEIDKGKLKLVDNRCLCKNKDDNRDTILAEKDRFGIPVKSIICSKCGLVRSSKVFDEAGQIDFYTHHYRNIYVGEADNKGSFYKDQYNRGKILLDILRKTVDIRDIEKVVEIGCGAGGIMAPFHEAGFDCLGIDFDEDYLSFGIEKGLNLQKGDYQGLIKDNYADVIILSHVMEHFTDPVKEMVGVVRKMAEGKYLVVEVPGIFNIDKSYFNPILYLQNAHTYSFYFQFLKIFFEKLGLNVLFGNEKSVVILQKPKGWIVPVLDEIYDESLSPYPQKISNYLYRTHVLYNLQLSPGLWKKRAGSILRIKKVKNKIRGLFT